MPTIGNLGTKIDLAIVRGATFGPHRVTLSNPAVPPALPTPVNLTGATIRGQIRSLDGELLSDINVTLVDPIAGIFDFELTDEQTADFPAGALPTDIDSKALWSMDLVDSLDRTVPLFYGNVTIHRRATTP